MRGSIRIFVGLLMAFGAVGGLDTGNDLLACTAIAAIGLAIMYSGVRALKEVTR